ncbi:DUF4160 domain-containing protein [Spirosoma montaniterrae]|uniref:DUF4160 domain-containing protein n=1 Tax=Spirosoma montaniterrae TaxID=1178516 RepID=A0A1P9X3E4_9BACT|nr:DUF4160 domain-containing protein [Spirosoma montaniterrae]AQG82150.1 hypothetical protein AWR27_24355 [Spirosoma montaniterrae]
MPTVFTQAGLRFFFVMFDLLNEPFHIHVGDGGRKLCKYWIFADGVVQLADNQGFKQRELNNIEKTLAEQMPYIQETYGAYCTKNNIAVNYKIRRVA